MHQARWALLAMAAGFVLAGAMFVTDPQLHRFDRWSDGGGITDSPWVGTAAGVLFLCAGAVALIAFEDRHRSFASIAGLLAAVSFPAGLFVVIGGGLLTAEPGSLTGGTKLMLGGFAIVCGLLALLMLFGIVLRVIVAITGSKEDRA